MIFGHFPFFWYFYLIFPWTRAIFFKCNPPNQNQLFLGQTFIPWLSYVQTQLDPKYFVDRTNFYFGAPPYCPELGTNTMFDKCCRTCCSPRTLQIYIVGNYVQVVDGSQSRLFFPRQLVCCLPSGGFPCQAWQGVSLLVPGRLWACLTHATVQWLDSALGKGSITHSSYGRARNNWTSQCKNYFNW